MRNVLIGLLLGYILATVLPRAQADDHTVLQILRDIASAEKNQADTLRGLVRAAERCSR